jgi:hypothetical protein
VGMLTESGNSENCSAPSPAITNGVQDTINDQKFKILLMTKRVIKNSVKLSQEMPC